MADNLNFKKQLRIDCQIKIGEYPSHLHYLFQQRDGAHIVLKIPHKVLLKWREIKHTKGLNVSYQELLHLSGESLPFGIKLDNQRIEDRLKVTTCKIYTQSKGLRGYNRVKFLNKSSSLLLHQEELINVSGLKARLENCEKENYELQRETKELDIRCEQLLQELIKEKNKVKNLELELDIVDQENKELKAYLDNLDEKVVCRNCSDTLQNTGKPFHEVGKRQQKRKIKELQTTAERGLWFLESFGLTLESIQVKDVKGNVRDLGIGSDGLNKSSFSQQTDKDKETIRALLYIMDRCCVGDAAYHEITMIIDDLPRSYLVRQCRTDLNSIFHVSRTLGKHPGAQMSFKEELKSQLRKKIDAGETGKQKIRIGGDGAKMSRIANFIVISFAMLSDGEKVMSAKGNHTVGIISGHEDYDVLKVSCKELFSEINELIEKGEIEVDEHIIPVEF